MQAGHKKNLVEVFSGNHSFNYDLAVKIMQSKNPDAGVMICLHGMGANGDIIHVPSSSQMVHDHLVSFDFPDNSSTMRQSYDPRKTVYGSIQELLPPLYVIKKCVIDAGYDAVNLYGFSAGGGAIINLISVLVQDRYDSQLASIGITKERKKILLNAIQRGHIILDCPLKSVDEIIDTRGKAYDLEIFAQRYRQNNLRPIDSIEYLEGLRLNILLHFQVPDEILSNRDDSLFAKRLEQYNQGRTVVVIGREGGHNTWHASLWKAYPQIS